MSTVDELRNELASRAGDVPHSHHTDRLAGIRRKRTAQRRTMAAGVTAGVTAATALAVAAVVALMPGNANVVDLAPPPVDRPGNDSSGPGLPGAPVPVVEEKGIRFYKTPGIAALDGVVVGEPGQRRVEFSFVARADVLRYTGFCHGVPGDGPRERTPRMSSITVNGYPQSSESCNRSVGEAPQAPTVSFGGPYEREARIWRSYGVEAGARVQVVVELETFQGDPASDSDAVLGAGFWSVAQPKLHRVNESTLVDDVVEYQGVNYRYLTSVSASRKEGGTLAAPTHATGTPVLVRWGKVGSGGTFSVKTGTPRSQSGFSDRSPGATGASAELISSGDTSRARVTAERLLSGTVTLWVALYEPIQ
jgi:predicted DNA-binding WGR domain protein